MKEIKEKLILQDSNMLKDNKTIGEKTMNNKNIQVLSAGEGGELDHVNEMLTRKIKHVYVYKKYIFSIDYKGYLEMVTPEYYEVGFWPELLDDNGKLEDALLAGVVDFYDFSNRDMNAYPIEEGEVSQIKRSFTKEEIKQYFPSIECKGAYE